MNARILAFPIAVASIAALDSCKGIDINSPSVRACHDDSLQVLSIWHGTDTVRSLVVFHDDVTRCRKAA